MKYHIDTIPVWDAMKRDGECLLCALERKTELGEAERYLGASVMEPDIRVQVNKKGFCRKHHGMLFGMSNRLGHALMLESHTIETRERMAATFAKLNSAAEQLQNVSAIGKLGGKARGAEAIVMEQAAALHEMADSCLMCETIEENMNRYLHTFFHLYKNDTDFRNRFQNSKGVCLPHSARLLETAIGELSSRELADFIKLEYGRIGADQNITPREVIRDFIELLDLLYQNPGLNMMELLKSQDFVYSQSEAVSDQADDDFAEFTI